MKYYFYGRGPSPNLGFETITTNYWMVKHNLELVSK
jgi:hypothetical protein